MSGLWLEQAPTSTPAPRLQGDEVADVAIVGGGYAGLWTALRIKERDPAVDVAVVEAAVCGDGASGRNGGQAHGWWRSLGTLIELCGVAEALRLIRAADAALEEIGALDVDCHFARTGLLWTATTDAQRGAWEATVALARRHAPDADVFAALSPEEVRARAGTRAALGGVLERPAAAVHPALLARGLRERALARGVRIFERSPMTGLARGAGGPVVETASGQVAARRVVLTTNAWAAARPELRSRMYVVSSMVAATPPAPGALAELGLTPDLRMCDSQDRVLYWGTTRDHRLVFGRGGGAVALGGRLGPGFGAARRWRDDLAGELRRLYPSLAALGLDRAWAGPVDRTTSGLPLVGRLPGADDVLVGAGFSGTGIVQAAVVSHMLSGLALGADDEWTRSPLVDGRVARRLPPEPLRFLGAQLVRAAVMRGARAQLRGARPSAVDRGLARLIPQGLDEGGNRRR